MSSAAIYYRFSSSRKDAQSKITFDGTGISLWDLKREVILQNKMGKGHDFDIGVYATKEAGGEEFKSDNYLLPRSSSVVIRRLPPSQPGRGNAAQYVADVETGGAPNAGRTEAQAMKGGAGPSSAPGQSGSGASRRGGMMSMRFDGKDSAGNEGEKQEEAPVYNPIEGSLANDEEQAGIAAMFAASSEQWEKTQERMANATYRGRGGFRGGSTRGRGGMSGSGFGGRSDSTSRAQANSFEPDRPVPPGYVCFRCGTKGHYIQDCPTNEMKEWDDKPRLKRTTGIPKSMLQTVEAPKGPDGQTLKDLPEGIMITPDGEYVRAGPDSATWERTRQRNRPLTRSSIFSLAPTDPTLSCPICSLLMRSAVSTPCCSFQACEECIQTHLIEHEFRCPECDTRVPDLGKLKKEEELRKKVENYVEEKVGASEKAMETLEGIAEEKEEEEKKDQDGEKKEEQKQEGEEKKKEDEVEEATGEKKGKESSPEPQVDQAAKISAAIPKPTLAMVKSLLAMLSDPSISGKSKSDSNTTKSPQDEKPGSKGDKSSEEKEVDSEEKRKAREEDEAKEKGRKEMREQLLAQLKWCQDWIANDLQKKAEEIRKVERERLEEEERINREQRESLMLQQQQQVAQQQQMMRMMNGGGMMNGMNMNMMNGMNGMNMGMMNNGFGGMGYGMNNMNMMGGFGMNQFQQGGGNFGNMFQQNGMMGQNGMMNGMNGMGMGMLNNNMNFNNNNNNMNNNQNQNNRKRERESDFTELVGNASQVQRME